MACVAYGGSYIYVINRSSSGTLQYYNVPAGSGRTTTGGGNNTPVQPGTSTPISLPQAQNLTATDDSDFEPNGGCGFYNSHLYMTGTVRSSLNSTAAVADIDLGQLSRSARYSVLPIPYNADTVAKTTVFGRNDCLALAEGSNVHTFCTTSTGLIDTAEMKQGIGGVSSIMSYSSDTRLLAILGDGLAFDYNLNDTKYPHTGSYESLIPQASTQLPKGNLVPYRTDLNGTVEAILVPAGRPQYLIHLRSDGASIAYNNLTFPAAIDTGRPIYVTVNASDPSATDPPIYVASEQSEGSYQMHTFHLSSFQSGTSVNNNPGDNDTGTGSDDGVFSSDGSNNVGAIAGGVVGGVIGLALIIGLLIFLMKKRRKTRQPEFESLGEKSPTSTAAWNLGSSIKQIQETQNLSNARNLTVPPSELETLEPSSSLGSGAVVLGGAYQLTRDPPVFADDSNRIPKYVTRGIINQSTGQNYTLHYFTQSSQSAFLRSVNTTCALDSPHVIQHRDAITLNQSTQRSGYRYLWITAPCIPTQSLHNAFANSDKNVDLNDYPFKAWSTYALLEAIKDIHAANFVHLGLTPSCFFYADPEDSISDWQVTGFDQAHSTGERLTEGRLSQWSAPELFSTASSDNRRFFRQTVQPASDIWSLGCIIYTLATGRNLTIDLNHAAELSRGRDQDQLYIRVTSACNEAGTVNESYRTLLEGMLQPDPSRRSTAEHLAAYWKEANGLYDDDEEENNEAEENVVSP